MTTTSVTCLPGFQSPPPRPTHTTNPKNNNRACLTSNDNLCDNKPPPLHHPLHPLNCPTCRIPSTNCLPVTQCCCTLSWHGQECWLVWLSRHLCCMCPVSSQQAPLAL
jgi:hypothetical protein